MTKREVNTVNRPGIISSYRKNMIQHLVRAEDLEPTEAGKLVDEIIKTELTNVRICSDDTLSYGNTKVVYRTLGQFVNDVCRDSIVTPSGSIYTPVHKKKAFLARMIQDGLAQRKALKKKMFVAAAEGNETMTKKFNYAQSSVKIKLNSLPGGLGSPWNLFYDKGGYNAITSSARALIAQSYTIAESFLGGNWAWFNEEELLNHIYICIDKCPPSETINDTISKYGIKTIDSETLFAFMHGTVKQYVPGVRLDTVAKVLLTLEPHVIQFLYYIHNLRHLFWENENVFKPWMKDLLSIKLSDNWQDHNPGDLWKIDGDLLAVVFTIMSTELEGIKTSDLVDKHPDVARKCVDVGMRMQSMLDAIEPLFDTFIYTEVNAQKVLSRKTMFRNTVIISDTDSVIYTSKDWVKWYVGQVDEIIDDSYNAAAMVTYWLTKAVADTMAKYSIAQGATADNVPIMQMKNEFLYPALILYDAKKVYAGIIKVQEGVVLPKVKTDLKGGAIRSSDVSKESRDFTKDLIVEHILNPAMRGNIGATELINHVVRFEHKLLNSLQSGGIEYLARQSVNTEDSYDKPDSSAWAYVDAWNSIFGAKYDPIQPPDKVPIIKIIPPSLRYIESLKSIDMTIYQKFKDYISAKGRFPTAIVLSTSVRQIPEELLPLVDIRHIVFTNIKPIYLTLERMNIAVGYEKKKVLLSDVYDL